MSREDQYSLCEDHISLRRWGFSAAAILKHLPPPQQGPDLNLLSGSHLSQLTLKITHLQHLGFCTSLHLSCTHSFPLTPDKLLTIYMVILEERKIRSRVYPIKTIAILEPVALAMGEMVITGLGGDF